MKTVRSATLGLLLGSLSLVAGCAGTPVASSTESLRQQVLETERAFARTMAERDHDGFRHFLDEETVFFAGAQPLRGADAVAEAWAAYFEGGEAPFSWAPDQVEVLESGTLALSTGPVLDPAGREIARFLSIWRRTGPGQWRIVFDRGTPACQPCAAADQPASASER